MVVRFDATKALVDQFVDHHGMMEIYSHLYASATLFILSLVAVFLIYRVLVRESSLTWPGIAAGMISVGLIGLGEGAEHFFTSPFAHDFFHYLHMIAAPVALYFLYRGTIEFIGESPDRPQYGFGGPKKPLSSNAIVAIFGAMFLIVLVLASLAEVPWDPRIELPFLYITLIPTLILTAILVHISEEITESLVMVFIPIIAVFVSLLALDIWFGRYVDIWGNAPLYVITHNIQNVLHVLNGAILLLFSISVSRAYRLGVLYAGGERPEH
ncbi:MAG: hypothetical protein ACE5PM_06070 [Candidatus Hydrothermarchaeales archaeon]